MRQKEWLHYEVHHEGECGAHWNGEPWLGTYEVGIVTSGKSRVYESVFTTIKSSDGREWIGTDRWCYTIALKRVFEAMCAGGLQLTCAGLDAHWYQTGLSEGSGYGYLRGREDEGPFHIMDQR